MCKPLQPFSMMSGFPPTEFLLASLIAISDEISLLSNLPPVQVKNITAMTRRVRLLSPLFTEVRELNIPLLPSAVLCFTELLSLMTSAKLLIRRCTEGSYLWNYIQTEVLSKEFHAIAKEISKALDILPLKLMNITIDIREQVELLCKQAKRVELLIDTKDLERRKIVLQILATHEKNNKSYGSLDVGKAIEMFNSIGLRSSVDFAEEVTKLQVEATSQGGTGGPIVISIINSFISLLTFVRSMVFSFEENEKAFKILKQTLAANKLSPSSHAILTEIPNEFRCPISHELMREPVIVATGHTYDRDSISKWIETGRKTCPKSGWKLSHMALIPNYSLKSLIQQWLQDNNTFIDEFAASSSELFASKTNKNVRINVVKLTSEFLVGKLATASPEMQRRAAYETRLLAKSSTNNRKTIAEAGAIPFLVNLLNSHDPETQENAVTALLNLSINCNNKILIMAAGALEKFILVLENGKTMKSKENSAATISSLSIVDDYKASIGAQPRVIAALTSLLREGAMTGKRDATTALTNLALYNPNQRRIVHEGTVPLLMGLLMDSKAGITDDALTLLVVLLECPDGLTEITRTRSKDFITLLIDLLRFGSQKGKENAVTLLLALAKDGDEVVRHFDPQSFSLLRSMIANGSSEVREKASLLLRLLIKSCSNTANL